MRKLNSKGFLLVETLLVAIFIISTLMFLYTQFSKVRDSYKQSFNYNTVTGLYSAGTFLDYLQDSGIEKLDNAVKSSPFVDLTGCDSAYIKSNAVCEKLKGELNIKKIYFTKSDPANFKNDLVSQNLDREFKEFIHTIKAPDVATGGRLIVEYNDNTFATVLAEIKKAYLINVPVGPDPSEDDEYFRKYKHLIKNVSFVDYVDTTNAKEKWDLSEDKDGLITGWVEANQEDTSQYDLYIGSEREIYTKDFSAMFMEMSNLEKVEFSNLNTSENTSFTSTFYNCKKLETIDLSSLDTSKVTDMQEMFGGCSGLTSLDLSSFDTSNVANMYSMFRGCVGLTTLDLSSFDTSKVTDMSGMFGTCSGLTSLDLSNFNTSRVTYMDAMFSECENLTSLDLSSFDTSWVTSMSSMFYCCSNLTSLDLSSFNTSGVKDTELMFMDCGKLITIYASSKFTTSNLSLSTSAQMFYGCTSLVGGAGTKYDEEMREKQYARIDGGTSNPGYFTEKS